MIARTPRHPIGPRSRIDLLLGAVLGGVLVLGGGIAQRRALKARFQRALDDLDHDLRGLMTIIRGEVELTLSRNDLPEQERQRSAATVIGQLEDLEALLSRRYR